MGFMCDFCAEQRSVIYCRSDAASLCLLCDRNVHSANVLSLRHSRTLLCERCNAQPAFVRCVEEKICLCPNCDWKGHVGSSSGSMHKRQAVSCYSGCPSAAELQTIWSFFLKIPSPGHPSHNFVMGSMSTTECPGNDNPNAQEKERISDRSVADEVNYQKIDKSNVWTGSLNVSNDIKLHAGSTYAASPLVSFSGVKGPTLSEDDSFYEGFNMDEVDLSIENYEILGDAYDNPGNLFGNDDIDDIFGMEISGADSNCQDAHVTEGSTGCAKVVQPACSTAASGDSLMSCKTEPTVCFARPHSSISFSGVTGESSAGDYQGCGASSLILMGEPPWYPPCPDNSLTYSSRSSAVMRYKEKKKARKFEKKVRYASRKARADVRKRIKGRFVKAGDAYDYDPMTIRSC